MLSGSATTTDYDDVLVMLQQVHVSKIMPCEADVNQVNLLRKMISPGSRRSERRQEESRHTERRTAQKVPVAFRSSSDAEDDQTTATTVVWAHSRYRANVPWHHTLCFPRSQLLDGLTLRCTEGGVPADEVCYDSPPVCFTPSLSDRLMGCGCSVVREATAGT